MDNDSTLQLNPNLKNSKKSATLAINELSKKLQQQGKTIYRLGLGQSPFPVPQSMVDALREAAVIKDYLAVQGLFELRTAICHYIERTENVKFTESQVIVGPGSKELMYILQNVLNTDLLLPAPSWVSYQPQASLCGLECFWIPCSIKNDWKLTASQFEQYAQKHSSAKLMILNSPNNPSGACYTDKELEAIAEVARKHHIIILSDEIYSALSYQQHTSLSRFYPEGTIISNGISKWSGAGGWRLGFMAIPDQLKSVTEAMVVFASETYTSVSAPIQYAAVHAFEDSDEMRQYINSTQNIMRFLAQSFSEKLNQLSVTCPKPMGGFYVMCQFDQYKERLKKVGINSSTQLCERFLNDIGVACLPGDDFGLDGQLYSVRFALVDFNGDDAIKQYVQLGDIGFTDLNCIYKNIFSAAKAIESWLFDLNILSSQA
ncbi:MAG: aminotransferase class I/II-fold pyridoxal phosphate-dependent enzyme [Gammaproteobacteria bacterium]|nr:aminotransferase class I/II-fold pyridoxal phosphate-dependent enzyme [Gammaproteobacteria bacterium]